ncbi:MAG: hypothetical protein SF182_21985 [Deltaproteobacteria bacterium]|nr:hypothetical protein [Deltaproteobacteria bacterium]
MQRRFAIRTATYVARVGDLVARGSVEPRPYLEAYLAWWSGGLDDLGDSLPPPRGQTRAREFPLMHVQFELRPERGDVRFAVPVEVFDRHGDAAVVVLSTHGLVRRFDPRAPLRPQLTLAPELHVRIDPNEVRCDTRTLPELKIYGVDALVRGGDCYEGLVWGALKHDQTVRFPVAAFELTIA